MTREAVARVFGWKSLVVAGILLVTILAGAFAARPRGGDPGGGRAGGATTATESAVIQSGLWLRTVRDESGGPMVEVRLDDVLGEVGRGVVLDRPALVGMVQRVAGPDPQIEGKRVGDVLGKVSRVRVSSQGLSVVLGRRPLTQALQRAIARQGPVDAMTVGEVLDDLAGARLTLDGIAGLLDQDAVVSLLGAVLPVAQRSGPSRDPLFLQRQAMQRRYAAVVALVRELRRGEFADADRNVLYAAAHDRLLQAGQTSAIPLLDGCLRLEEELAAAQLGASSRAERIASRWDARRKTFGAQMADLLFSRDEAMERYEVDRLGLEADTSISAPERAQRLGARRQALRVELAAQGSYVSFPDETAPPGERDAPGEGRPQ